DPLCCALRRGHALAPRARRRYQGEAVGSERDIDLGPLAAILGAIPVVRGFPAPSIHDDFELVVRTERCPEGRDEVAAAEPVASYDAQAFGLIGHGISSSSNADAERVAWWRPVRPCRGVPKARVRSNAGQATSGRDAAKRGDPRVGVTRCQVTSTSPPSRA